MLKSSSYDFIFLGAGCSGLSLLMRLLRSGEFGKKKILLAERVQKNYNDRTWCFWETQNGYFEEIVSGRWGNVSFLSPGFSAAMDISPYEYKMIKGIDFYNYCFNEINRHENVEVVYGEINEWRSGKEFITLTFNGIEYKLHNTGTQVFNSIYKPSPQTAKTISLFQHFKGWVIHSSAPSFEKGNATMMDFRVHQNHGTAFVYVLPFDERTALVEYTLFSKELLADGQYDEELKIYINSFLGIDKYEVREVEKGMIPMTNDRLRFAGHGWQIGTAGGQTKASSGYTFQFIQKQSDLILEYLVAGKSLHQLPASSRRFRFYDNTLLYVLYHDMVPGREIFTELFKKNKPKSVLRFLDNESSFPEELRIISALPKIPFLKAAFRQF